MQPNNHSIINIIYQKFSNMNSYLEKHSKKDFIIKICNNKKHYLIIFLLKKN